MSSYRRISRFFSYVGVLALATIAASGCKSRDETRYPDDLPPSMAATETVIYQDIYIETEEAAPQPTEEIPDLVGYETLSSGDRVEVVTYVHTYSQAIETYPTVYWGGRHYYNVNGNFVFYSSYYHGWCNYWGPPQPLVYAWNYYYPMHPYYWGVGYYGAGYYWGGVGHHGYHAYGVRPTNYRPARGYMASKGGPSGGRGATAGGPRGNAATAGSRSGRSSAGASAGGSRAPSRRSGGNGGSSRRVAGVSSIAGMPAGRGPKPRAPRAPGASTIGARGSAPATRPAGSGKALGANTGRAPSRGAAPSPRYRPASSSQGYNRQVPGSQGGARPSSGVTRGSGSRFTGSSQAPSSRSPAGSSRSGGFSSGSSRSGGFSSGSRSSGSRSSGSRSSGSRSSGSRGGFGGGSSRSSGSRSSGSRSSGSRGGSRR